MSIKITKRSLIVYVSLLIAILFDLLSAIFQLVHRNAYSKNGIGYPSLEEACQYLRIFPDIVFLYLFLFISKGWLLREPTPLFVAGKINSEMRSTLEILILYVIVNVALLIWGGQ